jgi:hypothetical protein
MTFVQSVLSIARKRALCRKQSKRFVRSMPGDPRYRSGSENGTKCQRSRRYRDVDVSRGAPYYIRGLMTKTAAQFHGQTPGSAAVRIKRYVLHQRRP